jgi:hypothetical protein
MNQIFSINCKWLKRARLPFNFSIDNRFRAPNYGHKYKYVIHTHEEFIYERLFNILSQVVMVYAQLKTALMQKIKIVVPVNNFFNYACAA